MHQPIIYHGTPMTPRAALEAVLPGRAACVSFFRPDDLEAVEAVAPLLMFRPRWLFILAGREAPRRGMVRGRSSSVVAGLLCLARAAAVCARPLGDNARQPRSSVADQRRSAERVALRPEQGRAGLAHGWDGGAPWPAGRALRSRLPWVDRRPGRSCDLGRRVRRVDAEDGGGRPVLRQPLASDAYVARGDGRSALPVCRRRFDVGRAERVAI